MGLAEQRDAQRTRQREASFALLLADDGELEVESGTRKTYADIVTNGPGSMAESFEFLVLGGAIPEVEGLQSW